ncbi:MAG: DUF4250 domain-containing protein [Bacilli bacterium]|nr:DUF4250 domain-containing protein [Bacilli bacterium]
MLPRNPEILLSCINTKLRDQYSSLEELCDDLDEDKEEIIRILENNNYHYDPLTNQFK